MKIQQIQLNNFRTYSSTVINLSDGFNVIVGQNDSGKSNIIRAIQWVLYNTPPGDGVIRKGEAYADVTLVLDDGTRVQRVKGRIRGQSINLYNIKRKDGEWEEYNSIGRDVPYEVRLALGVSYYTRPGMSTPSELNIMKQGDTQFLIGDSPQQKVEMLNYFTGVEPLGLAAKDIKSDTRDLSITIKDAEREYANKRSMVERNRGLVLKAEELMSDLESLHVEAKENNLEFLEKCSDDIDSHTLKMGKILRANNTLKECIKSLLNLKSDFMCAYNRLCDLKDFESIGINEDILKSRLSARDMLMSVNPTDLSKVYNTFNMAKKDRDALMLLNKKLQDAVSTNTQLTEDLDILGISLQEKMAERSALLKSKGICPLCGSSI